jgi:Bacterial PH domain
VPVSIPQSARLAHPRLDGSGAAWVAAGVLAGVACAVFLPTVGIPLGAVVVAASLVGARRRRTIGAYEGAEGLVVRNWFATHELLWASTQRVEDRRDTWAPWLQVPVVLHSGGALPVSALRHRRASTPATALTLARVVRDRRDERARDRW